MVLAKAVLHRNRILIVEDDLMQAEILQAGLTKAGFNVDLVSGGLAAVAKVEDENYDAVLVDYNIPEMDGLALARVVGDFLGPIARPILIALTATPERIIAREGGAKSAFDLVLDKSCGPLTLVSRINHCLASAPDALIRQAAKEAIYDQAEEDYVCGPDLHGRNGDERERVRILLVEDNELQQSLLTDLLENRGYVVETAKDGLEAIRRIRENCFDLVIVDYRIPELDGVAVASLVHDQMSQEWRPRLVAFTAAPDLLRNSITASGPVFDGIVEKSSQFEDLLASIDQLLRSSPNPTTRRLAAATA